MRLSKRDILRFWVFVDKRGHDKCWLWRGGRDSHGYGRFWLGTKMCAAHRVAYLIGYGVLKECVLHKCDTLRCVNPAHLRCGTKRENTEDCIRKGRIARGARHGCAKLSERQVLVIVAAIACGETQQSLALKHGVSREAISQIACGKRWQWLTGLGATP